uniref:Pectinesterase catalytic domain-containing protein n=1 Tax=Physcomitrium patens TaxID=3218 RepID=A0A2K1JCG6_PHYPA|nr:hypothetical protein PHYPA_019500 [Physcomitrium patens]
MELQKTSIDSIKEISLTDEFRLQESSRHSYELLSHALAILNALAVYGEHFLLWRPTAFSLPDGVNASLIPSLPGTPGHRHQKLVFATSGDNPSPPDWIDAQTRRHLLNNPTYDVVVEQDGSGKLRTIQEAVDAYNENSIRRVIYIRAVITGSRNVALEQGTTTVRSATLIVLGRGFIGRSFKVENTAGPLGYQAVAFRGTADRTVMYQVTFDGYQDTLYAHSFRRHYRGCTILRHSRLRFIAKMTTLPRKQNTYTEQGRTDAHQNTGFSFQNCIFDGMDHLKLNTALHKSYLGRPWKQFFVCVIMKSEVKDHIDPQGWLPWNKTSFGLFTSFFAEFENFGPGSSTVNRVPWSRQIWSAATAIRYHASSFVQPRQWVADHNIPLTTTL